MRLKYIFLLLAVLVIYAGCYKEDFSDCPHVLYLYYRSVMQKYTYEDVVEQLDIYLYDTNGQQISTYTYSVEELDDIDFMPKIPVEKNTVYSIVSVLNAHNDYTIENGLELQSFKLSLNTQSGDTVREKQDDLFYGMKQITVIGLENRQQQETIDLYKNTNHINLNVSFRNGKPDGYPLFARLEANNGSFDYTNKCYPQSFRIYEPYLQNEYSGKELFCFTTMQIWLGSVVNLFLETEEGGRRIQKSEMNIVEVITKVYNTEEKLAQEDIFNINLILDADYTIFELSINEWYVIKSGEEI